MVRTDIKTYHRYGEAQSDGGELLHLEDIPSRSSLHDWVIRPHVHGGIAQILFVQSGAVAMQLDGEARALSGPALVWIPGGVVHGFDFAPDTQGWVLSLSNAVFSEPALAGAEASFADAPLVLPLDAEAAARADWLMADMARAYAASEHTPLLWLLGLLLHTIDSAAEAGAPKATTPIHPLVHRFQAEVNRHFRAHWPVPAYAEMLSVSIGQLTRACLNAVGQRPGAIIQNRVFLEAKRRLTYTNASLAQIADDLGFADPAYFARAFKRYTGETPGRFRAQRQS